MLITGISQTSDTILTTVCALGYAMLPATLGSRYYYYTHYTDQGAEPGNGWDGRTTEGEIKKKKSSSAVHLGRGS